MIKEYLFSRNMYYTPTDVALSSKDVPNGIFIPRKHKYNANNRRKKRKGK